MIYLVLVISQLKTYYSYAQQNNVILNLNELFSKNFHFLLKIMFSPGVDQCLGVQQCYGVAPQSW